MKRRTVLLAAMLSVALCSIVLADYRVAMKGDWPESWPKELDPIRKQARTLVGPTIEQQHFEIPFTDRETFEAAWPHFLKVKSKGAPIFLIRAPKTDFMAIKPAGLLIHSPPTNTNKEANPEQPLAGNWTGKDRSRWMWTTYIELVADGNIVDLNRLELPADTPIIDERFKTEAKP